ncbi:MAG: MBL fold metallo-hydrolase [Bacillota bacterium]
MTDMIPVKAIHLPTPFPVGDVNAYLIKEDPVTLIDPGLYYTPSEQVLCSALEQYGVSLSDIKRIVITHGHLDHYGMAGKIQDETDAEVIVREEEMVLIKPDRQYIENMACTLRTTGVTEEMINDNVAFLSNIPFIHPIENITTFSGELDLEFSGFKIRMLHMPGHSGGHTCLYWEEEKILISGDMLLPDISSVPSLGYDPQEKNLRRRSLSEMLESMERIAGLNPGLCLPGHGEPVPEPGELAKSRIEFHNNRLEEIFNLVPPGKDGGMTPFQASMMYYPHVKGFDKLLAVFEVVSHLDYLADEGRIVEEIDQSGVSRFFRPI